MVIPQLNCMGSRQLLKFLYESLSGHSVQGPITIHIPVVCHTPKYQMRPRSFCGRKWLCNRLSVRPSIHSFQHLTYHRSSNQSLLNLTANLQRCPIRIHVRVGGGASSQETAAQSYSTPLEARIYRKSRSLGGSKPGTSGLVNAYED